MILQDIEVDARGLRDISIPMDRDLFRDLTHDLNAEILATIEQALRDYRTVLYSDETETPWFSSRAREPRSLRCASS